MILLDSDYSGFWQRVAANIVDNFLLGIVIYPIMLFDKSGLINMGIVLIYFTALEGSKKQGTIGKQVMNIKVADKEGNRISYMRAFARIGFMFGLPFLFSVIGGIIVTIATHNTDPTSIGVVTSYIYLIGFFIECLIVNWTPKKQGLHDIISGCVMYKHDKNFEVRMKISETTIDQSPVSPEQVESESV